MIAIRVLAVAGLAVIVLSGCARASQDVGEAETVPTSAASTCASLTDPLSDELEFTYQFSANAIDLASYSAELEKTAAAVAEIPVEPGSELATAITAFTEYGNAVTPDGVARVNDFDYSNRLSDIATACMAEGSELVVRSNHGG